MWTRAICLLAGLTAACSSNAPAPTPPPGTSPTVTITAAGFTPQTIDVALGSRVLFVNNDSKSHNVSSDPHPERDDCPEINQVGFLNPGDRRETGNLVVARACGFHDFDMASVPSLHGTINIK
jgi:plastocyanin